VKWTSVWDINFYLREMNFLREKSNSFGEKWAFCMTNQLCCVRIEFFCEISSVLCVKWSFYGDINFGVREMNSSCEKSTLLCVKFHVYEMNFLFAKSTWFNSHQVCAGSNHPFAWEIYLLFASCTVWVLNGLFVNEIEFSACKIKFFASANNFGIDEMNLCVRNGIFVEQSNLQGTIHTAH